MKPIQLKVTILVFVLVTLSGLAVLLGYKNYSSIKDSQEELISIVTIREILDQLPKKDQKDSYIKELQDIRSGIKIPQRQTLFSDVIQAFSASNSSLLSRRTQAMIHFENTHYKNVTQQLNYFEKRLYFHLTSLFVLFISTLIFLKIFLGNHVFGPLKKTTERMVDFLNGKYSYYFGSPPENELGELQATFNSMAQEVLRNMEELKALDSAKSDFLNIASHELRTPMTSIKGSLSLVTSGVMGKVDSEIMNLMTIAEIETDRLVRLINDILDMAKIDAKKLPLKLTWIDLNALITKTASSLNGLSTTFNVPIAIQDIPQIEIYADADRIQQVLTNLLSNAIKFSPQDKPVDIQVEALDNQAIKIMVRDHGKGMTPQEKSILFQKFRQVSSPDNPLVKGTGLGLAIAKALVEEHKGIIDVHTVPNEGSTFFFTLPEWKYKAQEERAAA